MSQSQSFVVEQFSPVRKNSLLGFVTVRSPSGLIFHDAAVMKKGDSVWVSPAAKPLLGRDGLQLKGGDGKPRWQPIVSFADRAKRDAWSNAVVAALQATHPDVLK